MRYKQQLKNRKNVKYFKQIYKTPALKAAGILILN